MLFIMEGIGGICEDGSGLGTVLSAIGVLVNIMKWLIPVALIIWGTMDLGKAVMEQKEDDIKKAYSTLIKRAVAAILVFIFPSVVVFLVNAFNTGEGPGDAAVCISKILGQENPWSK